MSKYYFIIALLFLQISCNKVKSTKFSKYNFKIENSFWDPNPYLFSTFIEDTIISRDKNFQKAAVAYSSIGDIKNSLISWDMGSKKRVDSLTKKEVDNFKTYKAVEVIPYILKLSKDTKVVIVNEAHHIPKHRVFTTRLLKKLFDQGYKHLGLETLLTTQTSDSILNVDKYARLTNGFYIKEPQYGNLVRQALNIGYKIFSYETMDGHGKQREIDQATNIKNYMEKYPSDKFLIHCGYSHADESDDMYRWKKSMAGRLKEFTSIDPLTINQTTFMEGSGKLYENKYFRNTNVKTPTVFINNMDSVFGNFKKNSWFDIYVFHPKTNKYNRAEWLKYGDRTQHDIDFSDQNIECPCLVLAYLDGEKVGETIPYDIQKSKNKRVKLILEPAKYNIVIWNQKGESLLSKYKVVLK